MGLDKRFMWGGSIYAVALPNYDVGLCFRGDCEMNKPYEIYRQPADGNWVRVEIVAETESGKKQGVSDYLHEFKYHDARVEYETGTTAMVRRFYRA